MGNKPKSKDTEIAAAEKAAAEKAADEKAAAGNAKPRTFNHDDREFEVLKKGAIIPGKGKFSADEIYADPEAQAALVKTLDERGSGIIKEHFPE